MNKSYFSVWNTALSSWVAVPETACAHCSAASREGDGCGRGGSSLRRTALALALTLAWGVPASAATLYWDTTGTAAGLGGAGTWDTTNAFWNTNATGTGGTASAWNNSNVDSAVFAGTAGTVSLGVPVTAGNLNFNVTGYTLAGSTLTLAGTPTLTTGLNVTATISSAIAGTAGVIKAGAGTLTLSGANTFSGGITVNAGILSVNGDAALGAASNGIVMAGGTQLVANTGTVLPASRVVTLASGNVTVNGSRLGAARYTGAGGLTAIAASMTLSNNANDYTGQTQYLPAGSGTLSFTSIADLGVASALGAPTTVGNGTVLVAPTSGTATLAYTGTGGSSNRNFTFQNPASSLGTRLRHSGSGTLTLTGNISLGGDILGLTNFDAVGGDLALLGVISDSVTRAVSFSGSTGRTITLGGNNTWRSVASISGVTVVAPVLANRGIANSLGSGLATNNAVSIGISAGGALSYTGTGASTNRGWTINSGTVRNDGSGALNLTGPVAISGNTATLGGSFSGAPNTVSGVISGVGTLAVNTAGTWALTGDNTYTGGTTITAGMLHIGSGGTTGSILGNVTNNGALVFNRSDAVTFGGAISGTGTLTKLGADTLTLTADNTYTGATTIAAGTLQVGDGGGTGSIAGDITNNSALVLNRSGALALGGAISGAGTISQIGSGVTTLSGNSSTFSGGTTVSNGTLWVNGTLGNAGSTMSVTGGGTLGGTGTVGGSVAINDGVLAPGNSPGTLTINGDLSLASASVLNYEFGQAGVAGGPLNDLTVVVGNLTLDGTLNATVSAGGAYGPGLYRVISYGGTLTDNGLALGTMPAGSVNFVQTSVAGQVNLINTAGLTLNFWDGGAGPLNNGTVNGGSGIWQASAGNANWTELTGTINAPYADGTFAIFAGAPGTVTVDNSAGAVVSGGMQFAASGYVVQGQPITLAAGSNLLRVGDGTAPSAGYVATIASELAGTGGIDKSDLGTLVLTGTNSYTGGTTISAGTLQLGNGGTTGSVVGDVTNNGTLAFNRSDNFTFGNVISGTGAVTQMGPNTLTLTGANSYTGATTVAAGTLRAGAANTFSAASAYTVAPGATLDINGFDQSVAALANNGTVNLAGATAGSALAVRGAYVGNAGILRMGTGIVGRTSVSDRLVLDGPAANASGSTAIQFTNLSGLGALTSGNGIEVISGINGGTTTAQTSKSAFSLLGGHVDAGAYEYRLYAADAQGAGENWYLRSTAPASPLAPPTTAPIPALLPVPTYRAEVPLLSALPSQLRQMDLAMIGNLHQRIGDDDVKASGVASSGSDRRAWGRVIAADIDIHQQGTVNPHSKGNVKGFQAGTDLFATSNWRAGVYVGQLDGRIRVNGFASGIADLAVGANDLRSQYLGAYGTWTADSGFYADAVLQAGRHRYTVEPLSTLRSGGKGDSLMASIEVGQAFALGASGWKIEPQVQLIHQRLSLDNVAISGANVRQDSDDGWIARVGVRLKGEIATGLGTLQPYGRFNLYKASSGTDVARFIGPAGATDITGRTGATSSELAGGLTLALSQTTSVYGEVGKLWASGGDAKVKRTVQGSLGLRMKW
ncbi:autotransporter outer membrane beta-barrel domain-containing protein [Variovorax paradoxus]|uniref:autotransporter outer membrane beta-barrel domain-containing protein n=1 Tax=Variovorax paradoxus TaxID=34073 RepID=UPI0024816F07|nr:autotransporter outer membrane beta-barrel domain-containing protein [Variovorax paradoxus]WGT61328.1 autotransporter outer membrane beta-barrel domain-containing protein [Variovorax paradoxus]